MSIHNYSCGGWIRQGRLAAIGRCWSCESGPEEGESPGRIQLSAALSDPSRGLVLRRSAPAPPREEGATRAKARVHLNTPGDDLVAKGLVARATTPLPPLA